MSHDIRFLICGNDCPLIVIENLKSIAKLYPLSTIVLYDWGHEKDNLKKFQSVFKRLEIIEWPGANSTNYTYHKVKCIHDAFHRNDDKPLVFIDSDIIIYQTINEVFNDTGWDLGITWRPEKSEVEDTPQWLNSGVIFMNNENIKRTKDALNIWLKRCDDREEKIWYIDQLELCRLCEDTINPKELINQLPERKSEHSSEKFTIKTFHFTKYNFLPSSPTPYEGTNRKEAKIIHFKGEWRKKMFELTPSYFRGFIPYTVLSFWGNQHRVIKLILKMFRILNKIYP